MNTQELTHPTIQLLLAHRSIRRYQDRPLPEGLLERLIACGQKASTSNNMQTYSIIHVSEKERKVELVLVTQGMRDADYDCTPSGQIPLNPCPAWLREPFNGVKIA